LPLLRLLFLRLLPPPPLPSTPFPYTTLFRSPVDRAKVFLQEVAELKTPVPFKVRNRKIHHRRGAGFGPGKWPVGTVTRFLKVLRSEEHTSELQSHLNLVCRLLLEKKNKKHEK